MKPWYDVIKPREDLREGKPLDASEFAVHLDQVREGRAKAVYQDPKQFFERTHLTQNLIGLAAEVVRRLSGEITETSAVFNMTTQFGGGKTHALTLLYHLAEEGPKAERFHGVRTILEKSGMASLPKAATAVFVGTEFDSIKGRGGSDGTPLRKTPWGEIAYQLSGAAGLEVLAEHERQMTAPGGDVLRMFIPKDRPCLILMDEVMNYVSRHRKSGMATQLYNFLQNLSEEARGRSNLVLAVSIPASELEMNAEDQSDYERFKKVLDRLGKAVFMAAESETAEIIRRRLFEWGGLSDDAKKTIQEYADWTVDHRLDIPGWFPSDHARERFEATYPFHPMVLAVFDHKWQSLPRFQQTRGILRLLALWVSRAYEEGCKKLHRDPLIGLGTAPLHDPIFRAALFEQLGEQRLEVAVTTDISGNKGANARRLDEEAVLDIKKARLHTKTATAIFFESNGGQAKGEATVPEIRFDVAEPGMDVGHVETVLETLGSTCFYLSIDRNRYRFGLSPNLNKLLSDRRASIQPARIDAGVKEEIQKVFSTSPSVERIFFPERSIQVPDRPVLALIILSPDYSMEDKDRTLQFVETMTRECGHSSRTFKSALLWCVPESPSALREEARKVIAWEDIEEEQDEVRLDETQKRQLAESLKKSRRDLKESVWRTYKNILLLDKDNTIRPIDLGLVHSSASESIISNILGMLDKIDVLTKSFSPRRLVQNWSPAFKEWSTRAVRDAFYASPQFPRLLSAEAVKETIAKGVSEGLIAYVGKDSHGKYDPFSYAASMSPSEVEISEDLYIVMRDVAEEYKKSAASAASSASSPTAPTPGTGAGAGTGASPSGTSAPGTPAPQDPSLTMGKPSPSKGFKGLKWSGEIPSQKWMNFYTKVLSRYASGKGLKLTLTIDCSPAEGISPQSIEETKTALRELGLSDDVSLKSE